MKDGRGRDDGFTACSVSLSLFFYFFLLSYFYFLSFFSVLLFFSFLQLFWFSLSISFLSIFSSI